MQLSTQPYKGTRDFYPDDMRIQKWIFSKMTAVVEGYGFEEYNGPMLEPFELYAAKTGEEIVNQQLYWMVDRGGRKIAVRPEMTPTLARMVAGKVQELPKPVRWFSFPNLWRYERPQRGRLREHWQLNVDILGGDTLLADAEILQIARDLLRSFGGEKHVTIKVNNRRLVDHFFVSVLGLTAETALAATKALDARAKIGEEKYSAWLQELGIGPSVSQKMEEFFHSPFEETAKRFPCQGVDELKTLFALLQEAGVEVGKEVAFDPLVLRGLDYYTGTVFEMYDISPDNRRAMFGGGRYDNLIGLFGNTKLSGVGFGMGDVTFRNFLETHQLIPTLPSHVDVFVSMPNREMRLPAEKIATNLRAARFRVITPLGYEGFGAQLKMASRHRAAYSVLLGESEMAEGKVILKEMATGEQETISIQDLVSHLTKKGKK